MDPLTIISIIGTIGSLVYGVGSSIYNAHKERETQNTITDLSNKQLAFNTDVANKNFDLAQEQFNYQKQLNDITMKREDTAFQRQVADLKAAGLSPLMVAGNGAAATPLTSSNAPQFDVSGINQALTNAIGSYNDIFNRRMQRQQFSLQSRVQAAQAFTQLSELKMQQKKANLENEYLTEKLKWEKKYGFRDYDWKSILTGLIDNFVRDNANTTIPKIDNVDFNTAGWLLPSKEKLYESVFGKQPEKTYNYNPVTIKKETDQLNKNISKDYTHAVNILTTRSPTKGNLNDKKYMDSVNYFYRFTNAWRDYETVDDFINNFLSEPDKRKKIQSIYPFIERKTLR